MTDAPLPNSRDDSINELQCVIAQFRFESAWESGRRPRAEDFVSQFPAPEQELLVPRLLAIEISWLRKSGHEPDDAEWNARFPNRRHIVDQALQQCNGTPTPQHDEPPPADEELPKQLGRYRVVRQVGKGGFGVVFAAYDDTLDRMVAIKLPNREWSARHDFADSYLKEARVLARLDHPHIVPVYDCGTKDDDGRPFVVSKFVDGDNLATHLRRGRPQFPVTRTLVAEIADALHFAHLHDIVHRDVKPSNILIDTAGKAYLADFGIVLRNEDYGQGPTFAGTPAYMSPEQARSEGHRVDGRSDVFSLGIVLFQMLTGRRPFHANSEDELLIEHIETEAQPPRQIDDAIPRDLERICLKALSKRASDRYSTAKDMADDLRRGSLESPPTVEHSAHPVGNPVMPAHAPDSHSISDGLPPPTAGATPSSDQLGVRIVPKGLRSFDAHDAEFFLQLLPGPRDRDGLPESIRFWKTRIEEVDPDETFAVGLLYGPSGCGKSSLIKAGLLPRLSPNVQTVYVEASANHTEARLLHQLRKRISSQDAANSSLQETMADIRKGKGLRSGQKLLIVVDQFEQWLHAHGDDENAELVLALRQCDGARVQVLITVRDDFWLAVSRFMRNLEIRLVEGRNCALVDLFSMDHAKKVLAAIGRAYDKIPARRADWSKGAQEFLNQAVAGLAQNDKVISVRLALFAEMFKAKKWTVSSLKEVGGMAGVGATFLEETFCAPTAPATHRFQQHAARAVLSALLPDSGSDIKGGMRSTNQLREASGYTDHRQFEDLLQILDSEVRLITPTDPEGKTVSSDGSAAASSEQYYQLTHDFLVPALRDWLSRKQKETRRGRAQLRLAERAANWSEKPATRHLPTWWEWLHVRLLTNPKHWTAPQREVMRRAARRHGLFSVALLALIALVGWGVFEYLGRLKANGLRDRLLNAATSEVPEIVADMAEYRRWLDPILFEALLEAKTQKDEKKQLHASLALLPADTNQITYLYDRLLRADAGDFATIRSALAPSVAEISERLWSEVQSPTAIPDRRFRAACAIAQFSPKDARWHAIGEEVAAQLVTANPLVLHYWTEALRPARKYILPPLAARLQSDDTDGHQRRSIAKLYQSYAAETSTAISTLEDRMLGKSTKPDVPPASVRQQANLAAALVTMGRGQTAWPLLVHIPDPTLRSYLIERLADSCEAKFVLDRLSVESDVTVRRALWLSLGSFGADQFPLTERERLLPDLLRGYRGNEDAGIHGALDWLLRQWGFEEQTRKIVVEFSEAKRDRKLGWFVNREQQTMIVIPGRSTAADVRPGRTYDFAIASKEVTIEEFLRHAPAYQYSKQRAPHLDCPAINVSWFQAAEYCNWLSRRDGLREDQLCYLPNKEGLFGPGMSIAPDFLERVGYRLPLEWEWELACRAGAQTSCSFGNADNELVSKYARFQKNSYQRPRARSARVGTYKPNDWGLFDTHGNIWELCQDTFQKPAAGNPEFEIGLELRVSRGGSYHQDEVDANTRIERDPLHSSEGTGFRVVKRLR